MTSEEYIKARLVDVARQVEHISFPAMCAILFAIRNRVGEDKNWGKVLGEVPAGPQTLPDTRNPQFIDLLTFVEGLYSGEAKDRVTGGGTFWSGPGIASWFTGKEQTGVVGPLVLYK